MFKKLLVAVFCITMIAGNVCFADPIAGLDDNNVSFDNGTVINAALADGGGTVELPAGIYYFTTPIVFPLNQGLCLEGQGCSSGMNSAQFTPGNRGANATVLCYRGDLASPAITYNGSYGQINKISVFKGKYDDLVTPYTDTSVGVFMTGNDTQGGGDIVIPQLVCVGFNKGLLIGASPEKKHFDNVNVGQYTAHQCKTAVWVENNQSVALDFDYLKVVGYSDTVFNIRQGGDIHIGFLALLNRSLVFRTAWLSQNSCNYVIDDMKVDPNAGLWRLIETEVVGPLRLRVGGHMGIQAIPATDAIKFFGATDYLKNKDKSIQIDVGWNRRIWNGRTYIFPQ